MNCHNMVLRNIDPEVNERRKARLGNYPLGVCGFFNYLVYDGVSIFGRN